MYDVMAGAKIEPAVVLSAFNCFRKFLAVSGGKFIPNVTFDGMGAVVFESWSGERKVAVYIETRFAEPTPTPHYIRSWGPDIEADMESGELESDRDYKFVWDWLEGK